MIIIAIFDTHCEISSDEFGNGHNLQALKDGNCTYATYITTPQGKISLQIDFRRSKTNNNS